MDGKTDSIKISHFLKSHSYAVVWVRIQVWFQSFVVTLPQLKAAHVSFILWNVLNAVCEASAGLGKGKSSAGSEDFQAWG